jgi:hypothetical protein
MTAWEKEWKLNADDKIMGDPDVSRFRLVLKGSGNFKYYAMEYEDGEMSDVWKNCCLVPRGAMPLAFDGGQPLPPWDNNNSVVVGKYKAAIRSGFERSNANTNRLECELDFGAKKKRWAMLFLLRGAIANGAGGPTDLLMVMYGKKFEWSVAGAAGPIEDGTGHGNSL